MQQQKEKPSFDKTRTELMQQGIQTTLFPTYFYKSGIFSYDKKEYTIIEHNSAFTEQLLVSIGAIPSSREIFTIDQQSKIIKKILTQATALIKSATQEKLQSDVSITNVLLKVTNFVKKYFNNAKQLDEYLSLWDMYIYDLKGNKIPVIPLSKFLQNGIGCCRHYAVLIALILNKLIISELLPKGEIYIQRDTIINNKRPGGHAWNIYCYRDTESDVERLFWIDGSGFDVVLEITSETIQKLTQIYGEGAINNVEQRYGQFAELSQDTLSATLDIDDLNEKSEERFGSQDLESPGYFGF